MANEKNLIPFNKLTESQQREIASKGGKASVEAKRKRKTLKEELLLMLEDEEVQKSVAVALIQEAQSGNVKAFGMLRDTIGERPVERSEHTIVGVEALQAMRDAELVQLAESGATGGSGDGTAG